ncbi:Uma2 family endonuclease [Phormidium yuhuli AB48]|uniref:Uma2 family endonuclease n=1 Tax=Phormidium yuhuli AB48 TaxID=2940671 RepID=A0ABY5AVE3_9CYAN|nr:Uma2 family endonuclease [Phormidium yuhuli]USR93212.1 Uma2 family endonuclease [Phormidium yuhuli AB48]
MIASSDFPLTPEEYLRLESTSEIKHEYLHGDVYAMTGASDSHVTIALNLAMMLRNHLRGGGCRVYLSDMKLRVAQRHSFFYPDVFVTCEPRDSQTPHYKRFPTLIVEVLSPSTEAFDRGEKFAAYQSLDSLQDYVLINTDKQRVETFRRGNGGVWTLQSYTPVDGMFELKSLQFQGSFEALYEDVVWETETTRSGESLD